MITEREDLQKLTPDSIDMSTLPSPKVIESLDFETIFQSLLADFRARASDYDALLESDPVIKLLQTFAYRELILRNQKNEDAKASMLAYATGSDLDNIAAFYRIVRLTDEDDSRLRYRTQLALEGITTAGSEKAYLFHALSASNDVKSAGVMSPSEGRVLITILSTNGEASSELCQNVLDYVSAEERRPLTDQVSVESATIVPYTIHAKVYVYAGSAESVVHSAFEDALSKYIAKTQTIGAVVARSGIDGALHQEGVERVELIEPSVDIATTKRQAPSCTDINLEMIYAT